jgi:hypothetical protein
MVTTPGTDLDDVVRQANARLQDHQKIRAVAAWPGAELPRTEGTRKLKRRELRQWLSDSRSQSDRSPAWVPRSRQAVLNR